jgi:hypothetical protein
LRPGLATEQTFAEQAAKRRPDMPLNLGEPTTSPRVCRHDLREPFDEDPALAKNVATTEASNSHRNRHGPTLPWKIRKPAIASADDAV